MHRFRTLLLLCIWLLSSFPVLPAQSGNEQELRDIRKRIEAEQRGIEEARKNKNNAQRNLKNLQKQLNANTRRLAELQKKEALFGQSLSQTRDSLQAASQHFGRLDQVTNDLFLRLYQLDNQRLLNRESRSDRFMIASLLASATTEMQQQVNLQHNLAGHLVSREEESRLNQWQRMVMNNNSKNYEKKIKELGRSISSYESKEEQHRKKIRELEQNVRDLEELIARLKVVTPPPVEPDTPPPSSKPGKMSWPARGKISRGYGEIRDPEYKTVSFNKGIDISLPLGARINAVESGVVVYAEWFESLGKVVIIDHQNGLRSVYSHVDRLLVSKGDRVSKGQQVAAGNGERSTELHFELRKGNQPVNPMNYLD